MTMMPLALARTRTFIGRRSRAELSRIRPRRCLSSASVTSEPAGGSSAATSTSDDAALPSNISPINTTLALSVHFRHPDLGMKDYEILSRATAFLLQVDPPDPSEIDTTSSTSSLHDGKGYVKKQAFPHLKKNMDIRNKLLQKDDYKYDPAGGPRRLPHQLNWLEFCPHNFRPLVHVVASSHVVSPWLWPKYYSQDWLKVVTQEHVRYSLEVWGTPSDKGKQNNVSSEIEEIGHDGKLKGSYGPLAKFALNPYPIHHPTEMDVAVIHLKQEEESLKLMKSLGIQPLHLQTTHELETSDDPVFEPGERVLFQGFEVYEANTANQETLGSDESNKSSGDDDERMFHPYSSLGTLALASPDRFLAQTQSPLPEGLCGGPAIQLPKDSMMNDDDTKSTTPLYIKGVVEGIIPINHENKQLAGLASFIPSYRIREFVDFAERVMLEQIIDKDLFKKVVELKEKKVQRGTTFEHGKSGQMREVKEEEDESDVDQNRQSNNDDSHDDEDSDDDEEEITDPNVQAGIEGTRTDDSEDTPGIDREYQRIISSLRENHTPEEVDAILATVEREREEVIKIMEEEGGDMDDAIELVRKRTWEEKDRIMKEIEREMKGQKDDVEEGEIVSSKEEEEDKKS